MLRILKEKDAPFMLEWMHDSTINCNFQQPFAEMTMEDVRKFIKNSFSEENKHFAIVDANDEYLGTVSLKNISCQNKNAEYAIVTRKKAHGSGAAMQATQELLAYAFRELGLHKVYLNVLEDNVRARKLYEKCGFTQAGRSKDAVVIDGVYRTLLWYDMIAD